MPAFKRLIASLPSKRNVGVVLVELADGRVVARTEDELEQLPLDEQTQIAAARDLALPPPSRS